MYDSSLAELGICQASIMSNVKRLKELSLTDSSGSSGFCLKVFEQQHSTNFRE